MTIDEQLVQSSLRKPGYRTTEFWMTLIILVLGVLVQSGVLPSNGEWSKAVAMLVQGLVALGYSRSRGQVKSG